MAQPDAPATGELTTWRDLQASLAANGQRRLVLLEGDRQDALRWLASRLPGLGFDQGLWTGPADDCPDPRLKRVAATGVRAWLGRELPVVVWDGWQGNPPDQMAALCGTLTAGGLLFWLMPALTNWRRFADPDYPRTGLDHGGEHPFAARMAALLARHGAVIRINPSVDPSPGLSIPPLPERHFCVGTTPEQQALIRRLVRFGLGRRRRPLVVTADRGRGKSAALGIAAAELLQNGRRQIVVTAPAAENVETLFRHAREALRDDLATARPGELVTRSGGRLVYMALRDLLGSCPEAEVVLVDEAAALPAPLLKSVLLGWPRVAYSTTVHGYEGAGRGFAIRFRRVLEQVTPQWQSVTLSTPVRWAGDDPFETLVSELFLLAADGGQVTGRADGGEAVVIEPWQPATANDQALAEAFGLLVDAHYRTSPADLRQWLDDTGARSWRARLGGQTIGVLWCAREGGFAAGLADQVSLGARRIRGHLLAQSLANHSGFPEAAALASLRIVRIAVAGQFRSRGVGRQLVAAATAWAAENRIDYLGTSFGGSGELLAFWQGCGLRVARVGLQREASSGEYPLQMITGISRAGDVLERRIRNRFGAHWLTLLPENWPELDPALVAGVTADLPSGPALDPDDVRDLESFAHGYRGLQMMVPVLRKLSQAPGVMAWLGRQDQFALWSRHVLQARDWRDSQSANLCLGQRQGEDQLRALVRELLENGPGL